MFQQKPRSNNAAKVVLAVTTLLILIVLGIIITQFNPTASTAPAMSASSSGNDKALNEPPVNIVAAAYPISNSEQRFGLTITGNPSPQSLDENLAKLGGPRSWYSYNPITPTPESAPNRVQLVRTGTNFMGTPALQSMVNSAPAGSYWMIGNEPNVIEQDNTTPQNYATQYESIKNTIKGIDPTAKLVGPNVLNWNYTCNGCSGYWQAGPPPAQPVPNQKYDWVGQLLQAYRTQYSHEIDFDVWSIHNYGLNWNALPTADWSLDTNQVKGLRTYLSTLPAQQNKPIWITEFGVIWGYSGYIFQSGKIVPTGPFQKQAVLNYLGNYCDWLNNNADSLNIGRWFLYTNYGQPESYATVYGGISLFDGVGINSNLTDFGILYRNKSLTLPLPPSALTIPAPSNSQITLNWNDNSNNEEGFAIERKVGANGSWQEVGRVRRNTPIFSDSGVAENTSYFYRVRAYNPAGYSVYTNESSTTSILAEPDFLVAYATSATAVKVFWTNHSSLATYYRVERQTGNSGNWTVLVPDTNTSLLDQNLTAGTLYTYRVRGYASNNLSSGYSRTDQARTVVTPVTAGSDNGTAQNGTLSAALQGALSYQTISLTPAQNLLTMSSALSTNVVGLKLIGNCASGPGVTIDTHGTSGISLGSNYYLWGFKVLGPQGLRFPAAGGDSRMQCMGLDARN